MSYNETPRDLPVPKDDGACDHLTGLSLPDLSLASTNSTDPRINLSQLEPKSILFVYPATGTPGTDLPDGWNEIPGARGCTPESLSFKQSSNEIRKLGYSIYGMSAQSPNEHKEAKARLALPYDLVSDESFLFTEKLALPTFHTRDGNRYMARFTLIIHSNKIQHVIYPVFPTSEAANMVLERIKN